MHIVSLQFGATEETEARKLLYYYPEGEPLGRQMLQVGLAEALVKFTRCVGVGVPKRYGCPHGTDLPWLVAATGRLSLVKHAR